MTRAVSQAEIARAVKALTEAGCDAGDATAWIEEAMETVAAARDVQGTA